MDLLSVVLPVFLVIGLGYGLRLLRFLGDQANEAVTKLVFYVAAPALLFRSTAQNSFDWGTSLSVMLVLTGITVLVASAVYVASLRLGPERCGVMAQGAHRSNMVFVGLPVILNAYGETALARASILIACMALVYNLLAVLVLSLPHGHGSAPNSGPRARTLLRIVRNPLILGCVGGILYSLLGIALPSIIDRPLELIGRTAAPLGLLSVGLGLNFRRLRAKIPLTAVATGIKLILYPALIYYGLRALGLQGIDLGVPVLLMASPTAVVSFIMAREMQGDGQLAGGIVIGTTVASLFTLLAWLALLQTG